MVVRTAATTRAKTSTSTCAATADTCAKALLRAGAAHVDVLVFARVVAAVRTTI